MRNIIVGGIGVLWGGATVVYGLLVGPRGTGAYHTGQIIGDILGFLMFAVGLYYFVTGIRSLNRTPKKRKRKKRRRELPAEDE